MAGTLWACALSGVFLFVGKREGSVGRTLILLEARRLALWAAALGRFVRICASAGRLGGFESGGGCAAKPLQSRNTLKRVKNNF